MSSQVRYAMIGGGNGAFIGPIHRTAAAIAGNCRLVAGAFSRVPAISQATGQELGLAADRCHAGWQDLIAHECSLPQAERAQFIAIVAPNNVHAPAAIAAMEAGFAVLIEKPLADTSQAAWAISQTAARTGMPCGVTHPYVAYPMALQARRLIAQGALGRIRRIAVRYMQGWLANSDDSTGKQAAWRLDPAQCGIGGAVGDIGTHAFNLVETMTGEEVTHVCADLRTVVADRALDDDGAALLRLSGGGSGTLIASQVCAGEANGLTVAIWGEKATLHWNQEDPNRLRLIRSAGPQEIWDCGQDRSYIDGEVRSWTRTPAGHPEGFLEAFANIYRDFADAVAGAPSAFAAFAPIEAGMRAMAFVDAMVASSKADSAWTAIGSPVGGN